MRSVPGSGGRYGPTLMPLRCGVGSISWEALGIDAVEIGFAVKCFVSSNSSFRQQGRSPDPILL